MSTAPFLFIKTDDIEWDQPFDGVKRKVLTGENLTICLYNLKAGLVFPIHQHPQEQMAYILEGKIEFTMGDGQKRIFEKGMFFAFAPNERHGAHFLEDSIVLDVFSPPMEEYKAVVPEYAKR